MDKHHAFGNGQTQDLWGRKWQFNVDDDMWCLFFLLVPLQTLALRLVYLPNATSCSSLSFCVKKCCPEGEWLPSPSPTCSPNASSALSLEFLGAPEDAVVGVVEDFLVGCKGRKLKLRSDVEKDRFYLQRDGRMMKPFDRIYPRVEFEDFCLERFGTDEGEELSALVCYREGKLEKKNKLYSIECLRKCCAPDQLLVNATCDATPANASLVLRSYLDASGLSRRRRLLAPSRPSCDASRDFFTFDFPADAFTISDDDGSVTLTVDGGVVDVIDGDRYCLETWTGDGVSFEVLGFFCIQDQEEKAHKHYTSAAFPDQNCGCGRNCVRRCCAQGFFYRRGICRVGNSSGIEVPLFANGDVPVGTSLRDVGDFLVGTPKCRMFRVNMTWERFYVQRDGRAWVPKYRTYYGRDRYCVEEATGGFSAFLCPNGGVDKVDFIRPAGMIISMPFLLCTFLVYLILPESNIHRKSLMFYVMTLFLGYMILVGVQLNDSNIPDLFCKTLGYGIIFFFISSFFWMNVMCVDMWLTFSGLRGFKGQRSSEMKRFLIYCAYALGTPFILLLIVFLVNTYGDPKSIFHPHLGISRCFLDDGYPNLFYFYLPMAIIIAINILMFAMTALRIQKVKKETSMLKHSDNKRHSFEEDKQKFNLYVKLLFAMGINWIMEVISWAVGWAIPSTSTYVWYITDFANAAYGLFIFFIFVFKHKTWVSLKKRYYIWRGQPHRAQALSTSNRTRTTREFSTTDTTLASDYRMSDMKNGKQEESPLNRN